MIPSSGKVEIKNICVFGVNELSVSVSAVIAYKCPKINVVVVDFNSEEVVLWDEKRVKNCEPELEDLLEKCQNENLLFKTDITGAILAADIILLMIDSSSSKTLKVQDVKPMEEAARLIADVSDSNKIVVQKYLNSPLKACEILKVILNTKRSKKVNIEVLAMPEFFSSASPVSYLLNPNLVLIGHERSADGEKATSVLIDLYTRWVPKDRIKTMDCESAELTRISVNALLAQRVITFGAFAAICEQSKKNICEITKVLMKTNLGDRCLEWGFNLDVNQLRDVLKLIYLCEKHKLDETGSYWREVLDESDYQQQRFEKKILSAFFNTLTNKKFAIFGLSFRGNGIITSEFPGIRLSWKILEEGASLCLYDKDAERNRERVYQALKECGAENVENNVTLVEDPYKAAEKVHGIIFCSDSLEFKSLDFAIIYRYMMKPAYIFDGRNVFDHEYFIKLGFKVKTIGRNY